MRVKCWAGSHTLICLARSSVSCQRRCRTWHACGRDCRLCCSSLSRLSHKNSYRPRQQPAAPTPSCAPCLTECTSNSDVERAEVHFVLEKHPSRTSK